MLACLAVKAFDMKGKKDLSIIVMDRVNPPIMKYFHLHKQLIFTCQSNYTYGGYPRFSDKYGQKWI